MACDVNDADSVAALAAAVPVCHVLVNNAGGAVGTDRVEDADIEDWRWMYEVNVLGLVRVTQALLPALRASGDAVVVNVGSTAGRWAYEGGSGYTSAKHAVKVVSETLRLELNGEPIRICEVAPGMVAPVMAAMVPVAPVMPVAAIVAAVVPMAAMPVAAAAAPIRCARGRVAAPIRPPGTENPHDQRNPKRILKKQREFQTYFIKRMAFLNK